jgi:sulfide dehydrogenase cytochrome subunit
MRPFSKMLALAAFAIPGAAAAEGIDELVVMCESCHGPAGVSQHADVPTIAGQTDTFLEKALRTYQVWGRPCIKSAYRSGDTERPRTDMCAISEGLTSEDIRALAAHYAAQAFVPAEQPFDPERAAAGKALHEEHCETCHHDGGSTAGRGPRLAGQWTTYLRTSLRFVPTGEHLVPPAMEMTVNDLGADEIDALMDYYASQQD